MKKLTVDTDVVIDYLRQPRKKTVLKTLLIDKEITILIPAVVVTELWVGRSIEKQKERAKVYRLLNRVSVINTDVKISKKAGDLIRSYQRFMLADALVAASSIVNKYPLVTFNKKHFEQIKELSLF